MKRVTIVGGPGSGKSTLARWMAAELDLLVFHMDLIHLHENWVERPLAEKIPLAHAVEARDTWVFEGGMSTTYVTRLQRADTVLWLDLRVGLRLWRVTKRLFRHLGKNRSDLPHGCVERFHSEIQDF